MLAAVLPLLVVPLLKRATVEEFSTVVLMLSGILFTIWFLLVAYLRRSTRPRLVSKATTVLIVY